MRPSGGRSPDQSSCVPCRLAEKSCYRWLGRFTKVSIDGRASALACNFFSCGSSARTQRTKTLGLVKPYLSHDPRLITQSRRHSVTSFCRAGSHSAREENFSRDVNSSGPITGPCSILVATLGLLTIFSSGAIRYHVCAWATVAKSIVAAIAVNTGFDITLRGQTLESAIVIFAICETPVSTRTSHAYSALA
jgi:hypothetical protein